MADRNISEAELLRVLDTGDTRFKDATHLWAFQMSGYALRANPTYTFC
jgi:hypothetical protein